MFLRIWSVLLVSLHISRGEEGEKCFRGTEASNNLKDWIIRTLQSCRLADGGNCQREQFQAVVHSRSKILLFRI